MNFQENYVGAGRKAGRSKRILSKRVPRIGWVVFSQHANPVHCSVKDFTEESAILTMSGWLGVPGEFTLYVEPDSIRAQCKVIRSNGSNVEVQLRDLEENIRFRSSHVTAA
ncbi:MAG: hypothetical protein AAF423_05420 [Pseudomonadota bacterium]